MRRPLLSAIAAAGLLLALAIPALSMQTTPPGIEDLPAGPAGDADLRPLTQAFPDKANATKWWSRPATSAAAKARTAIDQLVAARQGLADASSGRPRSPTATTAPWRNVAVPSEATATDEASMAALDELREDGRPGGARRRPRRRGQRHRRRRVDRGLQHQVMSERLPLVFAFVLGLAFLLMLFTFRSIVIPIKAIVLNLLSVGAAYGVLVMVVPVGLGGVAARLRVQRRRHVLVAAVPLRDPLRALDGLPRVHPQPGPRGCTTGA